MENVCNIVGIDPGNNLGLCVIGYNTEKNKIEYLRTEFFCLENYINVNNPDKAREKVMAAYRVANYIGQVYDPVCVGLESAFMNTRFPRAVIQLSQYVGMIESSLINNNSFIKIFKYPPKYIKASMGSGDNKKEDMTASVKKNKELIQFIPNIDSLTEHEIDAISIAYCALSDVRKYPLITLAF